MVEDSYKVVKAIEFKRIKTFKEENETTEEQHDCLTSLPRPLLHHILSYLTMKDVIGTCVLAKRWRYIWLSVPCLKFSPVKMRRDREVSFINRTLLLHNGPSIQKFDLTLRHHRAATNVIDSWIYFAQTRNVNELYLGFLSNSKPRLPHSIFSCRSLSVLALKSCFIGSPVTFSLSSLKILSLELVDFSDGAINDLVRSSPMLECLSLTNCQDGKDIDLDVQNVGMKTLKIHDSSYGFSLSSKLEVYAPFVVSFELVTNFYRKNYVIKRMQSLESASFGCNASYHSDCNCLKGKEHSVAKILAGLCHVKELRLSSCYIEPLSRREEQSLDCTLFFNATCLAIKTGLTKRDLPRIGYMLRHSPNIKSLIVNIDEIQGNKGTYNLEEGEYWGLQEPIFVDMLCNLKDVKIYNFMKNLASKSMSGIEDFLACLQNDLNFLRFLLKNSKVMERMTITTFKNVKFGRNSEIKKLKLLFQLTQELLAFPRASQAAQISFS